MQDLSLRLTHTYVGTWQHLDKWQHLGSVDEIGTRELPIEAEGEDTMCEPKLREVFALVTIHQDSADFYNRWLGLPVTEDKLEGGAFEKWVDKQISTALGDIYSSVGCSHEWDCCGCRSFYARNIERVARGDRDLWRIEVYSSRNY